MKKIVLTFMCLSFLMIGNIMAQSSAVNAVQKDASTVEILQDFKPTKVQKKLISKIEKYVKPRIFNRNVRTDALVGKSVKMQIALDAKGLIEYITVIKGVEPKLDTKVVNLVREYNEKKPFASSNIEKPSVIQIDMPLVRKKYYGG